jgi:hypothetical protein
MLYFIAVWIVLLVVCCPIGLALLNGLALDGFDRRGDRLITSLWLGVVMLAIALLAVSLILPLSPLVGAVVAIGLCALAVEWRKTRVELTAIAASSGSRRRILGFLGWAIAIAALTSRQVTWHDTGYYHYGLIQWLSQYGTVPGLSLLFSNLGFTSSWFALAAPLNASFFEARVSAVTNGFVLLLAVLHGLVCLHQARKRARLSDRFAIAFLLIMLPVTLWLDPMSSILVSPSPDLPIAFLVGLVSWAMLVVAQKPAPSNRAMDDAIVRPILNDAIVPLILATGAFTIKLTALPVLAISSLFFVLKQGATRRQILRGGAIVGFLLSPMLISGTLTSGCPLYPATTLCLDLPWSPTAQAVQQIAANTHNWTTWYGTPPSGVHPWLWAIGQWFNTSTKEKVTVAIILGAIGAAIYVLKTHLFKAQALKRGEVWVAAMGMLGITFLMLTSPFFRFTLPYITILIALLIAINSQKIFDSIFNQLANHSLFSNSYRKSFNLFLSSILLVIIISSRSHLLLPDRMKEVPATAKQANGISYSYPTDDMHCWSTKIPCTFSDMQNVQLADPDRGLAGGFVRKKSGIAE